jgi:hypothetical protein
VTAGASRFFWSLFSFLTRNTATDLLSIFAGNMFLSPNAVAALLGAVLALTSIDKACAHGSGHAAHENQPEDPAILSRSLFADSEGAEDAEVPARPCGTAALTSGEVKALASVVDAFYEGVQGPDRHRRLQKIMVPVNFIAIQNTGGLGAKPQQVIDQIVFLNNAFAPDFEFFLSTAQSPVNNNYYSNVNVDIPGGVQTQMKTQYKVGGKETLNIYALDPTDNQGGNIGGWAYYPWSNVGVLDGVVMDWTGVPGGGHFYFTQGDVSIECKSCWLVARISLFTTNKLMLLFPTGTVARSRGWSLAWTPPCVRRVRPKDSPSRRMCSTRRRC